MAVNKKAGKKSAAQNDFLGPSTPINVVATDVGTARAFDNGAFSVAFALPAGSLAATSYTVTAAAAGQTTRTVTGASSPLTVTGLKSATEYSVTVTASNAQATSAPSTAVNQTATTVPATPAAPTATANPSTNSDNVSWTAPANGGKAITGYIWSASDGKTNLSGGSPGGGPTALTSVAVAQEAGTAQTYNVYAINANGNSATSPNSTSLTTYYNFSFAPFGFAPFSFTPFSFAPFAFSCVGKNTEVATVGEDGQTIFVAANELQVGVDVLSPVWDEYDPFENVEDQKVTYSSLTNKAVKIGTISAIESKISDSTITINGDLAKHYSPTHPILARKSNELDAWEEVGNLEVGDIFWEYNFESNSYFETEVTSLEVSDAPDEVYLISVDGIDTFIAGNVICHK